MNRRLAALAATASLAGALPLCAQQDPQPSAPAEATFDGAVGSLRQRLEQSVAELAELRGRVAADKKPLSRRLRELEAELLQVRAEHQERTRTLDRSTLDVSNLRNEIKARDDEAAYLANLLGEYARNFDARLHIAEARRYEQVLEPARRAAAGEELPVREVHDAYTALLGAALERLHDALGGTGFPAAVLGEDGLRHQGRVAMVGPVAVFRSDDGATVGIVEQRLNSLEPTAIAFRSPADAAAAAQLVESGAGELPVDATLGSAHKVEATEETLWEHVQKGGPVMVPIFAMAGVALLAALWKWLSLAMQRRPSRRRIEALLEAVGRGDRELAVQRAQTLRGPVGRMLQTGTEHLGEPRELVEEVMYEDVLRTRLKLQSLLPFIAICAASAPLLGLLGTVTGIITTFKQITVFGTGDPGALSGGISEALITTKFGLIVAIPSLLMHAWLSRKARGITGQMESAAVALVNRIGQSASLRRAMPGADAAVARGRTGGSAAPDPELVRAQVHEIVAEMLGPLANGHAKDSRPQESRQGV